MFRETVVIATPDHAMRNRLAGLVDRMPGFSVIAQTGDLMNTYNVVEERLPKAVLIADQLAHLPEFEVMRGLFSALDVRWLIVTTPGRATRRPTDGSASDLFSIPGDAPESVYEQQISALTRIRQHSRPPAAPQSGHARTGQPTTASIRGTTGARAPIPPPVANAPAPAAAAASANRSDRIILIGASTGGVDALLTILSRFPENCPPTLIVQHTGSGFGASLAGLLDRQCLAEVQLATGPVALSRGRILIGAGARRHLVLDGGGGTRAVLSGETPVAGHLPSVDMLFQSAVPIARRVTAAILTGMGRDGATGMQALRAAGANTIAQDEASCIVYGMPRAAVENGSVQRILPLARIGDALLADPGAASGQTRELQK